MKHITEEYGQPCDLIESTCEEFYIMKEFLKRFGVEARQCISYGNTCRWQIRNNYKEWVCVSRGISERCEWIANAAEEEIKSGHWCR